MPRLFLVLVVYLLITLLLQLTLQKWINIEVPGYEEDRILKEVIMGVFFALFGVGLYESLYLFVQLKEDQIRLKTIEKQKVQNQLDVLRHQLSPHFLFNCFNSLNFLIDEDKAKGKVFVNLLSDIHKKILEFSEKDLITLEEEVEFSIAYVNLLKTRFGNNLQFHINIREDLMDKKMVPLALQITIENAIKHNTITKKQPLSIAICDLKDYIEIKNDNRPKSNQTAVKGMGLGLKNVTDRYGLLTTQEVIIDSTEKAFIVRLPVL
ncbi:sensor histidine kinase [Moorena bouillonii]|uniref:sensor histidine kinase n=1 Tax=Moorena bouillonii TaxID=207920 RepID=UPI001BE01EB7|nr:histidine kinase [Moorena bouillonii]